MRLFRIIVALSFTIFAGWACVERVAGPSAPPLPAALPSIVRQPPFLSANSPPPETGTVNPGDEVLQLHRRGITGRNIGIAIIDRFPLPGHREFGDRVRWYDEIDANARDTAHWHGTGTASIAAGKTIGVAPEADLYFVGLGMIWAGEPIGNWFVAAPRAMHTGQTVALAVRRVLAINRTLAPNRKIRAISLAVGTGIRWLDQRDSAIAEARAQGIFVSEPGLHPRPYGPVIVASPTAPDAYTSAGPAPSWAVAYWAGRYALAVQANPTITPEQFATIVPH